VLHKYPAGRNSRKWALKNNQTILYMVALAGPVPAPKDQGRIGPTVLKAVKIRVPDKGNPRHVQRHRHGAGADCRGARRSLHCRPARCPACRPSAVSGVDGKFWEVLKFFHATSHTWSSQIVTINNDTWKKISPAQSEGDL